ncbi:MAG: hypothetical protein WAL85_02375 [Candidatus Korobacteraceae bacterium]
MANTADATTSQNPVDDLNSLTETVAAAADPIAADAVSTLGLIQQARLSNQTRAATLTVATYGKDSAQATAAKQAVTTTTAASARLTVLSQQVTTPQPAVSATGWALHGRMYSSDLTPQAGYAVFLVDAQKNYLSDYGFSYTDATGYFLLSYSGGAATAQSAAAEATTAVASQDTAATPTASAAQQLFLQVTDANANPVLLSQTAFVPVVGQATYQAVTLPAGAAKLGDLPAEVRAVALPPIAAKTAASETAKATKPAAAKQTKG